MSPKPNTGVPEKIIGVLIKTSEGESQLFLFPLSELNKSTGLCDLIFTKEGKR